MSETLTNSLKTKRIAKNTLYLYLRSVFTMLISIYTSRVVLKVLGVEDYGIYNVVGGFVAMFSLISSTFTTSTQRFLTFELGKKENQRTQEVFSVSINIHIAIAIIIILLLEIIGWWFLNNKLVIPEERLFAANWVFQFSILAFAVQLVNIPFKACVVANERMKVFAIISMLEAVLKLIFLYLLIVIKYDKLITYSILMLSILIVVNIIYIIYCNRAFNECKYRMITKSSYYKSILGFSGWNFIGTSSAILSLHGLNILLNLFWGVTVNAAKGITSQVQNAVNQLVNNFMMSLNPQITKSYSGNDNRYMMMLVERGARFSFYLMLIISLPIIIETEYILKLWLTIVPDYTIIFIRLSLVIAIIQTFSNTLVTVMMATGKIKNYQITVGLVQMLNFPISYLFLKLGFQPQVIFYIMILNSLVCVGLRIYFVRITTNIPLNYYIISVIIKSVIIASLSIMAPLLIVYYLNSSFLRLFLSSFISFISSGLFIYLIGLDQNEKVLVKNKVVSLYLKHKGK